MYFKQITWHRQNSDHNYVSAEKYFLQVCPKRIKIDKKAHKEVQMEITHSKFNSVTSSNSFRYDDLFSSPTKWKASQFTPKYTLMSPCAVLLVTTAIVFLWCEWHWTSEILFSFIARNLSLYYYIHHQTLFCCILIIYIMTSEDSLSQVNRKVEEPW